jgi:hypothetical protein
MSASARALLEENVRATLDWLKANPLADIKVCTTHLKIGADSSCIRPCRVIVCARKNQYMHMHIAGNRDQKEQPRDGRTCGWQGVRRGGVYNEHHSHRTYRLAKLSRLDCASVSQGPLCSCSDSSPAGSEWEESEQEQTTGRLFLLWFFPFFPVVCSCSDSSHSDPAGFPSALLLSVSTSTL